jgi:hypothetical protein
MSLWVTPISPRAGPKCISRDLVNRNDNAANPNLAAFRRLGRCYTEYGARKHRVICRSYGQSPKNYGRQPKTQNQRPNADDQRSQTNYQRSMSLESREHRIRLIRAYAAMVTDWANEGWKLYLVTFMFKRLSGRPSIQWEQMKQEIGRIHHELVTGIERDPKRHPDRIPRALAFFDAPTNTWKKMECEEASVNDGLHAHAFFAIRRLPRRREDLKYHFGRNKKLYLGTKLRTIDVERVTGSETTSPTTS